MGTATLAIIAWKHQHEINALLLVLLLATSLFLTPCEHSGTPDRHTADTKSSG
jgi:hypothetical protein